MQYATRLTSTFHWSHLIYTMFLQLDGSTKIERRFIYCRLDTEIHH